MGGNKTVISQFILLISSLWIESPLASEVGLIKGPGERSQTIEKLEFIKYFYGIGLLSAVNGDFSGISSQEYIRGTVITARVYHSIYWTAYEHILLKSPQRKLLPILVIDLTEESNTDQAPGAHSGNGISLRELPKNQSSRYLYAIVGASGISKELARLSFPCDKRTKEKAYYFNSCQINHSSSLSY